MVLGVEEMRGKGVRDVTMVGGRRLGASVDVLLGLTNIERHTSIIHSEVG